MKPSDEQAKEPITIRILDKEFLIACAAQERASLLLSARHLDERMREIRDTGRVIGLERISIMAALNIANEMLQQQSRNDYLDQSALPRIAGLQSRMQRVLDRYKNGRIDF
ncbi:MAG: cell division protein ZapA [Chromatiales bacterium]|nr:cell division protein ZapA [Chromatiales bacterium]